MSWYWWALIYVAAMLAVFRILYPIVLDDHQRAVYENSRKASYERRSQYAMGIEWNFSRFLLGLTVTLWPVFFVGVALYALIRYGYKAIGWILFPRGVTTKFDREQKLLAEKKETEDKYKEAKRLLELEGIRVE